MLSTNVGIFSAASLGGGQYTFQLFFQDTTKAKFLRVGDTVRDSTSKEYQIITWSTHPSDFASSGTVTVTYITSDAMPTNDSGFNSRAFTPGQLDVRPAVRTDGNIFNISFISGQNLEYQMSATWILSSQAAKAEVGDSIVDSTGKEYVISYLSGSKFSAPFKVVEAEAEGITPSAGIATLYRATGTKKFYQGTALSDPARTLVQNRDIFKIDQDLAAFTNSSPDSNESMYLNNSGSTISKGQPVRLDSSGNVVAVNVSVEDEALATIGVAAAGITNGNSGTIVTSGIVPNITTSAEFDDMVFISKTGVLTNIKPDIGVASFAAGDFVISAGVIAKNKDNPAQKDLIVNIQIMGQL